MARPDPDREARQALADRAELARHGLIPPPMPIATDHAGAERYAKWHTRVYGRPPAPGDLTRLERLAAPDEPEERWPLSTAALCWLALALAGWLLVAASTMALVRWALPS